MTLQPTQLELESHGSWTVPHLRWVIGFMLFLAAILNYIDRQALSILAPTIQKSLGLDDAGYGRVVDFFLIAYTISLLLTGRLVDKVGARWAMAIFITWRGCRTSAPWWWTSSPGAWWRPASASSRPAALSAASS